MEICYHMTILVISHGYSACLAETAWWGPVLTYSVLKMYNTGVLLRLMQKYQKPEVPCKQMSVADDDRA